MKLEPLTDKGSPRCQGVRQPYDEEGNMLPGVQCKKVAIPGRPFCKYHGGKAGRAPIEGPKSHSKYHVVPKNLQQKFEAAIENPDILNLTKSIALLDSQIWEICEESATQSSFTDLQRKQLSMLIREHRELVGAETARRIAIGSLIDVGDVLHIINYIYDSIVKNVKDNEARSRIAADLRTIIGSSMPAYQPVTITKQPEPEDISEDAEEETIIDASISEVEN